MRTIAISIGALMLAVLGFGTAAVTAAQGGQDKITICHGAGQDGTTQYVTLTISAAAVYGPAGHFYENGTPRAGHEDDSFGACEGDETTTDTTTTDTTTDTTTTDETTTDTTTTDETTTDTTTTDETTTEETTTDETTTEVTTTTEQPGGERCPPGMSPTAGKDGESGNDECEYPPTTTTVQTTPPPVEPPAVTPPVTPPVAAPPTVTPPVLTPPTAKPTVAKKLTVAKPVQQEPVQASARPEPIAVASQGTLPFTGLPLWAYALAGVGMFGSGLALLRRV